MSVVNYSVKIKTKDKATTDLHGSARIGIRSLAPPDASLPDAQNAALGNAWSIVSK
jgi:hypothetical protein